MYKVAKTRLSSFIATFCVCFVFWLLITWTVAVQELVAGVIVSAVVSLFSSRFFIHAKAFYLLHPCRLINLLYYSVVIFIWELIKSNCKLAVCALSPRMKINPGFVRIPTRLRGEYAQTMLANSITLTPGTITVDIEQDKSAKDAAAWMDIHWINVEDSDPQKAGELIKGRMEKCLRRVWS